MWHHLQLLYFDSSLNQFFSQKNISIIKLTVFFKLPLWYWESLYMVVCFHRASDRSAGLHAEESQPAADHSRSGGRLHWGYCCGLWTHPCLIQHWRRVCMGLQLWGPGTVSNDVFCGYLRICEYLVALMSSLCVLQLGLGHSNPVKEPTLVTALQGKNIRQISAGRCHTSAWTTPALSTRASGTNKS